MGLIMFLPVTWFHMWMFMRCNEDGTHDTESQKVKSTGRVELMRFHMFRWVAWVTLVPK